MKEPSEAALLAEYQACQHDVNAEGSNYWTLASIFIGISSALFVAAVFGIISNKDLYEIWLNQLRGQPSNVQPPQVIIIVVGLLTVMLLGIIRLWLRRVSFLQQTNLDRMREIERKLGMWKSWRVHGIDHWDVKACDFDDEITEKVELLSYKLWHWWWKRKVSRKYAPSSGRYYDPIFAVLIFLWLFLAFAVSSLFKFPTSFSDIWITGMQLFVIGIGDYFIIQFTRVVKKEQT